MCASVCVCGRLVFFLFFPHPPSGINRTVLKIATDQGAFVVYSVEEIVVDDWHEEFEEIQKRGGKNP